MQIEFNTLAHLANTLKELFETDLTDEIFGLMQVYSVNRYGLLSTIDVFKTHQNIQENITKSNAVEGYDMLLNSLRNEVRDTDFELLQINIVTEKSGYILFTDLEQKKLFGFLKMNNQKLESKTELTEGGKLRGTWTDKVFFFKGNELS